MTRGHDRDPSNAADAGITNSLEKIRSLLRWPASSSVTWVVAPACAGHDPGVAAMSASCGEGQITARTSSNGLFACLRVIRIHVIFSA